MFLVSLVGATIGTAIPVIIIVWVYGSMARATDKAITNHITTGGLIELIPLVASIMAGIFIYRHTSRWRKLQSLVTALLVVLFSYIELIASLFIL
jgi:hypothetical protein